MILLKIKPLSVNSAWCGRRFKTKEYKAFEKEALLLLRPMKIPEGKLFLKLEFGFSNRGCDLDNPEKMFIDVLQKKYLFNDNRLYSKLTTKKITPKGQEYIMFEILPYIAI